MTLSHRPIRCAARMASLTAIAFSGLNSPAFAADTVEPMASTDHSSSADTATFQARGVIRPGQTAEIAAGMSGRLTSAPYSAGRYFKKGATLAAFDCTRQEAELSALTQAHATLSLKHDNTAQLHAAGAAGALELSIAKSEAAQAAAERDVIKARLKDCTVYAPFAGYVVTRHVRAHETPALNAPLYSILRAGSLELSVIAPSSWTAWATSGTTFDFHVDETGERLSAKILRLGASVDPVSQTIEITARPTSAVGRTKPGMSGVAQFTPQKAKS